MEKNKIYIVTSYTDTVPGKLIKLRAKLKFWNRYLGDEYSHVSLSRDNTLNNMMSFARKDINNPFDAGLIKENIRESMFALKPDKSKIAVMELDVTKKQYDDIGKIMEYYWSRREKLGYNFLGLVSMLFVAKGVQVEDQYFCSQWVASVLQQAGLNVFNGKQPCDIRPFDFYCSLKDNIIYEGMTKDYQEGNKVLRK